MCLRLTGSHIGYHSVGLARWALPQAHCQCTLRRLCSCARVSGLKIARCRLLSWVASRCPRRYSARTEAQNCIFVAEAVRVQRRGKWLLLPCRSSCLHMVDEALLRGSTHHKELRNSKFPGSIKDRTKYVSPWLLVRTKNHIYASLMIVPKSLCEQTTARNCLKSVSRNIMNKHPHTVIYLWLAVPLSS